MNIERMSWDDLRFALALARHPTMIAAANALHVHQSTVSRRIHALELDLGVKLFELSESGIVMTESGRRVAQRAEKIETLTAELESDIDTERPDDRQSVRISAVSTFITGFLNRHAAAFLSDNPDIRLDFVGEERNAVLERREADMAIRHVRPAGGQARIRKLADMSTTVYAAPKFIQSNGALKPDVPWVGFSRPLDFLPEQQWIDANVAPKNIIVTLASSATYADTVTREIGVGMLSCMVGDQRNNLQRVISSVPIMHRESWLMVLDDTRQRPAVRTVINWLTELCHIHSKAFLGEV
jgi:DNA-binding transcriptional LysR family regulator